MKFLKIILLSLIILTITACSSSIEKQLAKPYFLKYGSTYQGYTNEVYPLNIVFMAADNSKFVKENLNKIQRISLVGASNIEVMDWKLTEGKKYKNSRFFNIVVNIKNLKSGTGKFSRIQLDFSESKPVSYDIGKWDYRIIDKSTSDLGLEIRSNVGSASEFKRYTFEAKNTSNKNIVLNIYKLKNQSIIKDIIAKLDNKVLKQNILKVAPNQNLELDYIFNSEDKYEMHYFSPLVKYEIDNEEHTFLPGLAFYDYSFSDEKNNKLYKEFLKQR